MCGSRKEGRPKPKFKDTLKSKLKWSGIIPRELEASAVNWRPLLQTDQRGDPSPHEQQLSLNRTGVSVSLMTETDVTELHSLQPKQHTIVATPVGVCVLPALD